MNIYADDTTLWMANSNPLYIQHGLQEVSTKQIYGKQDGLKRKENKTATCWSQANTFLLHKPIA